MTQAVSLAPTFIVPLGEVNLTFTPTMGFIRRMGIVEDMASTPEPDGIVATDLLLDAYQEGTKRHHKWEDIVATVEDYTFIELIAAVYESMMARLGEVREAQSQSP